MFGWIWPRRGVNPVALAAFGKHPAWDDHVDNLGVQSHSILAFQRAVYHQGIAAHVNAGTWDRLDDDERLEGFGHWVCSSHLSSQGDGVLVGRIWSSVDGKGRARYPMIACVDCGPKGIGWAFGPAMATLEQVAHDCAGSSTPQQVRGVIHQAAQRLMGALDQAPPQSTATDPWPSNTDGASFLIAKAPAAFGEQGMKRILYQIQRDLSPYLVKKKRGDGGASKRPSLLRVPRCVRCPQEAVGLWLRFAMDRFKPGTPVMIVAPIDREWVDMLVGEPAGPLLWCLRAGLKAIPMTTTIPYKIDLAPSGPVT